VVEHDDGQGVAVAWVLLEELGHLGRMELEVAVVQLVQQELPALVALLVEGVLQRLAAEEQVEVVPPSLSMAKA
jgi:hypothetical protein